MKLEGECGAIGMLEVLGASLRGFMLACIRSAPANAGRDGWQPSSRPSLAARESCQRVCGHVLELLFPLSRDRSPLMARLLVYHIGKAPSFGSAASLKDHELTICLQIHPSPINNNFGGDAPWYNDYIGIDSPRHYDNQSMSI